MFLLAALIMGIAFLASLCISAPPAGAFQVPCQEDEAAVVQIDHNPAHGLDWQCENVSTVKECQTDEARLYNPDAERWECHVLDEITFYTDPSGHRNWYITITGRAINA